MPIALEPAGLEVELNLGGSGTKLCSWEADTMAFVLFEGTKGQQASKNVLRPLFLTISTLGMVAKTDCVLQTPSKNEQNQTTYGKGLSLACLSVEGMVMGTLGDATKGMVFWILESPLPHRFLQCR